VPATGAGTKIASELLDAIGRKRVGLALGSGSARGLAHIGVIRALQHAGIDIALVAGTSIGAVIGALFASGQMERAASEFLTFDWKRVAVLLDPVFPRAGLIHGSKVVDFLRAYVGSKSFEDLALPLRVVASDLRSGREAVFASGDLIQAVRASIAVPGLLTPKRIEDRILVDGGLVNPVPVSVARAMGAEFVVAVDLNGDIVEGRQSRRRHDAHAGGQAKARLLDALRATHSSRLAQFESWLEEKEPLPGIFEVLLGSLSIMQARITDANLQTDAPDLLIRPALGSLRFLDFDRAEQIVEAGYDSAQAALARQPPAGTPRS
jgi:NTE family protein